EAERNEVAAPRPEVRASLLKATLQAIDELDEARSVRAALPPEVLPQIEGTTRVDWLSIELHCQLSDAVFVVLGTERTRLFWRRNGGRTWTLPLMASAVRGLMQLFGVTPRHFLLRTPDAYAQTFRNAGTIRVEEHGSGEVRLLYDGLPVMFLASGGWRIRA